MFDQRLIDWGEGAALIDWGEGATLTRNLCNANTDMENISLTLFNCQAISKGQ